MLVDSTCGRTSIASSTRSAEAPSPMRKNDFFGRKEDRSTIVARVRALNHSWPKLAHVKDTKMARHAPTNATGPPRAGVGSAERHTNA